MSAEGGWTVRRLAGTAHDLHHRPFPDGAPRLVEMCRVTRRALVLGSTQTAAIVDAEAAEAAGVEVTGRRSGGGAVLLDPDHSVWIDVTVPRGDELWDDDVNQSFHWLAERWVAALARIGTVGLVHRGPLVRSSASSLVCFAGLGAGEVTIDGHKVVGLSQRRTREAARLQSVAYVRGMPAASTIVDLLAVPADPVEREWLRGHLDATVGRLDVTAPAIIEAVLTTFV